MNDTELGNLRLTADQEAAIVGFLKTLSDGYSLPDSGRPLCPEEADSIQR